MGSSTRLISLVQLRRYLGTLTILGRSSGSTRTPATIIPTASSLLQITPTIEVREVITSLRRGATEAMSRQVMKVGHRHRSRVRRRARAPRPAPPRPRRHLRRPGGGRPDSLPPEDET